MSEDVRITMLKDVLAKANITGLERDDLADQLALAQRVNGSSDPNQQLMKTVIIGLVRDRLMRGEEIRNAIADFHKSVCPMRNGSAQGSSLTLKFLGLSMTGKAATIGAVVVSISVVVYAGFLWQTKQFKQYAVHASRVAVESVMATQGETK